MLNKRLAGSTCATWTVLRGARRWGLGVTLVLMALTVGSVLGQTQTSCVQPPCGMVSWWPGDQNPNDIVDGNGGTLVGGYAPGVVDWAFSFAAAGDGVDALNAANLNFGPAGCAGSDLSIDAWIFVDTNLPGYTATVLPIVDKRSNPLASTAVGYFLFLYDGKPAFQLGDSTHGFYNYISTGPDLRDGAWHHVAVTVDRDLSAGGNLYVDGVGVLPFDPTNRQGSLVNVERLVIGRHAGNPSNTFVGLIDEVEIFNRALSQPEIQDIVTAQSAGKCKGDCVSAPLGMVSWWPGDDNPNDIVGVNPGMLLGSADYGPGMVGRAFRLNALGDCVRVSPATSLNFGTAFVSGGDLSIDAWIFVTPAQSNYTATVLPIVDKRALPNGPLAPDATGYFLFLYNGRLAFQLGDGMSSNYISSSLSPDLLTGGWHHVAVTVDRNSATGGNLYVDGVPVLAFDPTSRPMSLANNAPLLIGRHAASSEPSFIGLIDEVEIFSRPLSPQEVWGIFNAGSAGKCKCYGGLDLTISTGPCTPWLITQVPLSGSTLQVGPAPVSASCLPWASPPNANVTWVGTPCTGTTGPGTYVYEYTFCLCDCYSNVQMKFYLWAEDSAKVFLNNGPQIFGTPLVPLPSWWSAPGGYLVDVSSPNCATPNGFVIGVNTLKIEVSNASPGPSGMMVSGWIGAYVGRCCP